ncbi:MAG: S8 family serine peptidase [Bdellovibrionaceae bacterium]|nr:S8 family serine peptidase [Pseudobdellovibrionaceae bacterium]
MKNLFRVVIIVILGIGTAHCAKKSHVTTKAAPTTEEGLGFIAKTTDEQLHQLTSQYPNAQVRALSIKNGIYEISHAPEAAVQSISSQSVYKNMFIHGLSMNERPQALSLEKLAKNTSDDANAAIDTCKKSESAPEVDADLSYDTNTLTVELGDEVTIKALGKANATVGGDVRFLWDVQPPGFSKQTFAKGISSSQTFTPDSPGFYQVALVAQGADSSCALLVVPLFVTANPELSAPQKPVTVKDQSPFVHLTYVRAAEAWKKSKGDNVLVAILDTGVNYNHMGIRSNIAEKTSEIIDGKDDDNDGFVDDRYGWDFMSGDRFPFDDEGHGSHVAGLVASPISGVAPHAKILPVKVLNAAGGSDIATVVAGIYYSVDSGAKIINASLGWDSLPEPPKPLLDAVQYARTHGVIFMAAAGNGDETGKGFDIKKKPTYPASFKLDNLITVAATALNAITSYSNFNDELVHIAAPGGNEKEFLFSLSTLNPAQEPLAGMVGTSMATPVSVGVAALMLSVNSQLSPVDVRTILMETGDPLPSLKGKTASGTQVNAEKAVTRALDLKPAKFIL